MRLLSLRLRMRRARRRACALQWRVRRARRAGLTPRTRCSAVATATPPRSRMRACLRATAARGATRCACSRRARRSASKIAVRTALADDEPGALRGATGRARRDARAHTRRSPSRATRQTAPAHQHALEFWARRSTSEAVNLVGRLCGRCAAPTPPPPNAAAPRARAHGGGGADRRGGARRGVPVLLGGDRAARGAGLVRDDRPLSPSCCRARSRRRSRSARTSRRSTCAATASSARSPRH